MENTQNDYELDDSWLDKPKYRHVKSITNKDNIIPKGSWEKCNNCYQQIMTTTLVNNLYVCDHCGYHLYMPWEKRIEALCDPGSFKEYFHHIQSADPLNFKAGSQTYKVKLKSLKKYLNLNEGVIIGKALVDGIKVILMVMEFKFIGGSMGSAMGERIFQGMLLAAKKHLPFIAVCSSGGARMQEGLLSLMQMAKTCAGVETLAQAQSPFIPILTHPTMGGVTASFASLGDVILSEPGAMIGFAGRRVIEQTVRQKLTPHFQDAELLKERGFIDIILTRQQLKPTLVNIIHLLQA